MIIQYSRACGFIKYFAFYSMCHFYLFLQTLLDIHVPRQSCTNVDIIFPTDTTSWSKLLVSYQRGTSTRERVEGHSWSRDRSTKVKESGVREVFDRGASSASIDRVREIDGFSSCRSVFVIRQRWQSNAGPRWNTKRPKSVIAINLYTSLKI